MGVATEPVTPLLDHRPISPNSADGSQWSSRRDDSRWQGRRWSGSSNARTGFTSKSGGSPKEGETVEAGKLDFLIAVADAIEGLDDRRRNVAQV